MKFTKIDLETWSRKESYNWFTTKVCCRISMTTNIDVTNLVKKIKDCKLRCYPAFIYAVSNVINSSDEYKMALDENENLGVYDIVNPRYPLFHDSDKSISVLWTEYESDFKIFYDKFINDINTYGKNRSFPAKNDTPQNCFDMSVIPWSSFTSFDCPPTHSGLWLSPLVVVGKFFESEGKLLIPVSISVHHAICDGYHVSMFFKKLQDLCKNPNNWI